MNESKFSEIYTDPRLNKYFYIKYLEQQIY